MIKFKLPVQTGIKKNKRKIAGFTLLETLVAISILMVAVAAPITIAQKGLTSASYSKNQLIASYLAQDAIEYLINKRDSITIAETVKHDWALLWTDPAFSLCVSPNSCQIDTNAGVNGAGEIRAITQEPKGVLFKSDPDGFYGFTGRATNFTRTIQVTKIDDSHAMISVTVKWSADVASGSNSITVKTLIYNY